MSISQSMLPELEHELAGTRRTLERVPFDKADWRPHPKSFSIAQLASHIANLPTWMKMTIDIDNLDLGGLGPAALNPLATSHEELMAKFDRSAAEAKAALAAASDERLLAPWSLSNGPVTYFTMPRVAAIRGFIMNHNVHHRAQLTVYLRMLDVPVPSLYGPSADEQGM
jgi:uncharacterized damage-inducible protein DinB